jgi:hypothetical protein
MKDARARARAVVCGAFALTGACAHAPPDAWPQRPAYLGDQRVTADSSGVFTPIARERARTDEGRVVLRTTGAEEQARATALRFARALHDGDAATLNELLPTRVALTLDGSLEPRDELIDRCLKDARALIYATERDLTSVLDLTMMRVERAGSRRPPGPLPIGIDAADFSVTLPLSESDEDSQRRIPCMTTLYVRTGRHDRVVGIAK